MLGRQDSDDITTPLTRAGTLIELRQGGHRVYWKGKGKEATEEFPQCEDKGFHALMSIGWYELGELPPSADGADGEGAKRKPKPKTGEKSKRRGRKREEEEEDEFDDEADETDDEPDAVVENDSRSDDESDEDDVGVQCYKELQRPRRGMEHYWNRVDRGGMDVADKVRLHVVAVCRGEDDGQLYFKYYDVSRFVAGPPKNVDDYDYTLCDEMDPAIATEDCWMQWDALPDTTCTTSTARGVRVGSGTTIGRPPPRWKGYVVLTPEEVENQSRIEQAKHLEDELTSSKRTRRHHI